LTIEIAQLLVSTFPNIATALITLFLLWKKLDDIDRYLRSILDKMIEAALKDTDEIHPVQ